ncbi:MAG: winged helix-turn-helix domain-containing protein, partial [Bdellovibrionota bacterium]
KTEALQFHLYDNYFRSINSLLRIHAERLDFDKCTSLMREVDQVGSSLKSYKRYQPKIDYNQGIAAMHREEPVLARIHFEQAGLHIQELLLDETLSKRDREELIRDQLLDRYCLAILEKTNKNYAVAMAQFDGLLQEIYDLTHGEKAFEFQQLHDLEAGITIMQGHCQRYMGEPQKALDKYWAAHSILKSHRNWGTYYYVLLGLGQAYMALGNAERAQIFFDLISDAISDLELNRLKRALDKVSKVTVDNSNRLLIDRERKVIIEPKIGEVHFERRFVLLEIFYLLASQPGKIFSKEDLVDKIWRESYNPMIHDSKVYTSISRLRKLIEPDFKRPIYILNERDGYAFSATVTLEEVSSRTRKTSSVSPAEGAARPELANRTNRGEVGL